MRKLRFEKLRILPGWEKSVGWIQKSILTDKPEDGKCKAIKTEPCGGSRG